MADKRVIEQTASSEIYNDDWFLKDSVLEGTTKISAENLAKGLIDNVDASDIAYDNTTSGLEADNVQDAIDETLENAGKVDDVKVDGTSVVTNKVAEIEIPVKDVQVKTDSTYDSVVDASGNAKIDLSSMTAYGEVPNLPQAIATFKDGADAPMKSLKVAIEPQQDLHGYDSPWVGGAGKNKFDISKVVTNAEVVNNGTSLSLTTNPQTNNCTAGTPNKLKDYCPTLKEGDTVTFSFESTGDRKYIYLLGYNDQWNSGTSKVITDSMLNSTVLWYTSQGVSTATVSKIQFELGSSATSFAPYSNICPISGWDEVNVTRCGKNLCDPQIIIDLGATYNDDIFAFDPPKPSKDINVPLLSGKTITLSYDAYYTSAVVDYYLAIIYTDNTMTRDVTTPTANVWKKYTMTSDPNKTIKAIRVGIYGSSRHTSLKNIQIEEGSVATEYEPYAGTTYIIDLDGTRYGGELDVVSGELVVDSVYYQFDSSKTYSITGSARLTNRWITSITNIPNVSDEIKSRSGVISSISPRDVEYTSITVSGFCKNLSSPYPIINLNDSDSGLTASSSATDIANAVNTFLHQHTPQVVYELATPITVQLTPTQVKSLLGQNNIWADTGDINDCVYRRDMTSTIDDIIARLEALEG